MRPDGRILILAESQGFEPWALDGHSISSAARSTTLTTLRVYVSPVFALSQNRTLPISEYPGRNPKAELTNIPFMKTESPGITSCHRNTQNTETVIFQNSPVYSITIRLSESIKKCPY